MESSAPAAPRLSLPREHGGYITLLAATLAAVLLSSDRVAAFAVGLALAMGFCARAPLEYRSRTGALRPWDVPALLLMGILAAAGVVLAGGQRRELWVLVLVATVSLPVASAAARQLRKQRHELFELLGMTFLGASGGLGAAAGGASVGTALVVGVVMGFAAGTSVPLLRTELRRSAKRLTGAAVASVLIAFAGGALFLWSLGQPAATLALVPRVISLPVRSLMMRSSPRPMVSGMREIVVTFSSAAILFAVMAGAVR